MEFLDKALAGLGGPEVAGILAVVEVLLRLVKSDKPRSLILLVSGVLKSVAKIAEGASGLLDKVVPQKLK